jgi:hypothetical protein
MTPAAFVSVAVAATARKGCKQAEAVAARQSTRDKRNARCASFCTSRVGSPWRGPSATALGGTALNGMG